MGLARPTHFFFSLVEGGQQWPPPLLRVRAPPPPAFIYVVHHRMEHCTPRAGGASGGGRESVHPNLCPPAASPHPGERTLKLVKADTGDIVGEAEEQDLALVDDKFKFTSTGLIVRGNPTFQEWEDCGQLLAHIQKCIHWWIGDWLNYGEQQWGEAFAQAVDPSRFAVQTLANDKWVASKIPRSLRKETLSFTHHALVAPLEPEERKEWLDKAETKRLTTAELRKQIKKAKSLPNPGEEQETVKLTIHIILDVPIGLQDRVKGAIGTLIDRMSEEGIECGELKIWEGDHDREVHT